MFKRDWFEFYSAVSSHGRPTVIMFRVGTIGHRILLSDLTLFATVDLASSVKTKADYTVVQVWGYLPRDKRLFMLDQERERVEGPELVPMMWRAYRKWDLSSIWVEQVNFELSIIADARFKGLPVRSIRPRGDKVTRALPATAKMEGGLILFPLGGAKWWDAFESELLAFNRGKNDDQVDCLSYAVKVARKLRKMRDLPEMGYGGAGDYSTPARRPPRQRRALEGPRPSTLRSGGERLP